MKKNIIKPWGYERLIDKNRNYMFKKWKTSRSGRGIETKKKIEGNISLS